MRSEQAICVEIRGVEAAHHKAGENQPAAAVRASVQKLKTLRAELSAMLGEGAKKCPGCGKLAHAMQKRPGVYEVGCLTCAPKSGKPMRARGTTAGEAVSNWNDGKFI